MCVCALVLFVFTYECVRVQSPITECIPPCTRKYSRRKLRSHLTSALGAVIDGPLGSVLVHNAVVDADATVNANAVLDQFVLVRLGGRCRRSRQNTDTCYLGKTYFSCGLC